MTKKKRYGIQYLVAAILLIAAAFLIGWYLERSVVITHISVEGNDRSKDADIVAQSGLAAGMHGENIVFIDVIDRIKELPWVASAYVYLPASGHLQIRVEEEDVLALLAGDKGHVWVTESGIKLPVIYGKGIDVPLLHGFTVHAVGDTLQGEAFQKVRKFLNSARNYPGLYPLISEVMFTERDGVVILSNEHAVRLTFGHDGFKERLKNWQAFQSQIIAQKGIRRFVSLDFRYQGQIVAKKW